MIEIQIKKAETLQKIEDLRENLNKTNNELATLELLEIASKSPEMLADWEFWQKEIENALDGCEVSLDAIKQELGYDTILKDWNIERERANIDIKERNARILTIENWLEANKQRTIQKEIAEIILEYLKAGDCDKETLKTADSFINANVADATDDCRNLIGGGL